MIITATLIKTIILFSLIIAVSIMLSNYEDDKRKDFLRSLTPKGRKRAKQLLLVCCVVLLIIILIFTL